MIFFLYCFKIIFSIFCISFALLYIFLDVYASPIFPRNELQDKGNDTIIIKSLNGQSKNVTPYYPSDNITSVTYSSNGTILNATLWLKDNFTKNPIEHIPHYSLYVDIDSNNNSGYSGVDYIVELSWDNETKTWTRQVSEISSSFQYKILSKEENYIDIPEDNSSYVNLYFDLSKAESPSRYIILFVLEDTITLSNSTVYETRDFTNWIEIPTPVSEIIPSLSPLNLQQGEKKVIEVKITSSTKLPLIVNLNTEQNENITSWFNPNEVVIPPKGWTITYLNVDAADNASSLSYTITLSGSFIYDNMIFGISSTPITVDVPLTVNIKEPMTPLEQFAGVWNAFGPSLKDSYALISALIVGIIGLSAWINKKIKKKRDIINESNSNNQKQEDT